MPPFSSIEGASFRQPCHYHTSGHGTPRSDTLLRAGHSHALNRREPPVRQQAMPPVPRSTPSPTSSMDLAFLFGSTTSVGKPKRSVRFSDRPGDVDAPVTRTFYPILSRFDYAPLELAACWHTHQDYTQFRREAMAVVLMATHADPVVRGMIDDVRHAMRGCENRMPAAIEQRHARRQRVRDAVLGMQRWGDPAAACRPFSAASQQEAWSRASQDARDVASERYHRSNSVAPQHQVNKTLLRSPPMKPPQIVNNHDEFTDDWISSLNTTPPPTKNQDLISLDSSVSAGGFDNGWLIDFSEPISQ